MGQAASRQEAFWEACGFGHIARVRKYIEDGIDVDWVSYTHDCCPIHVASQGKPEIVQMLIDAKCNVNVRDDRGNSPLHHGAMKGHSDILRTLIAVGSDVNAQDKNGWTPLHHAGYFCQFKAVKALLDCGADITLTNKDERTALHETARSPESDEIQLGEITRLIIAAGSNVDAKATDMDEADFTPLMFASYHGHPEVASVLIEANCNIDARGTSSWTALHWASDRQNDEVVYMLLEAGANPTYKSLRGELAVDRAESLQLKEFLRNAFNMYKELEEIEKKMAEATQFIGDKPDSISQSASSSVDVLSEDTTTNSEFVNNSSDCVDNSSVSLEAENEKLIERTDSDISSAEKNVELSVHETEVLEETPRTDKENLLSSEDTKKELEDNDGTDKEV